MGEGQTKTFGTLDKVNYTVKLEQALRNIDKTMRNVELNKAIIPAVEDTLQATAEFNKKGSKPKKPPILKDLEDQIRDLEYQGYCIRQKIRILDTRTKRAIEEKHSLKQ